MSMASLLREELRPRGAFHEPRRGVAGFTPPCHEKRVAEHCQVRDIESFLPTYQSTRRWRNGCTVSIESPLFPGYVFIRVNQTNKVRVLELPGVVRMVGARGNTR